MPGNREAFQTAINAADRRRWDRRWVDAVREYQHALAEFPDDSTAHSGLGFCYMQLKQWQQALDEYETVLKHDQSNVIALNKMAELYGILNRRDDAYASYLRLVDLYSQAGQTSRAEAARKKVAQFSPPQVLLQKQPEPDVLPAWLESLRALAGASPAASQEKQASAADKPPLSLDDLLDPNALPEWMQAKPPEKPVKDPASFIDINALPAWLRPQSAPVQPPVPENDASISHRNVRVPDRPRGEIQRVVPPGQITVEQIPGLLKQAQLLQAEGRTNEAINVCEQIVEGGFNRPDARYFLGWLYQERQRWDEAIAQFQMLLNDLEYALSSYYALGQCYRGKGDLRNAIVHFDEAVDRVNLDALQVDEADQLVQLCREAAEAHLAIGEREQAQTVYHALLGFLRSRNWKSHATKAELLLQPMQTSPPPVQPKTPPPPSFVRVAPPDNVAAIPLVPSKALPEWLTGILRDSEKVPHAPKSPKPPSALPPEAVVVDSQSQGSFSSTQLPANTILKGRYRILERLGKGGMGAVYKAKDADLNNRFVAVKQMRQNGLAPHLLTMYTNIFKSEANLLAMLMHPNLPRIYEHFFEAESWFLVMDYIDGRNLQAHLEQSGGRLPIAEALRIACDLCTVLDYLHQQQPPIIFRDLKPSNVMLTPTGHLYLIDFGIARQFKPEQMQDTHHFQTAGYAAPEQFSQKATTPKSDIYSLGATLHQLLSGNDPAESAFDFSPLQVGIPALTTLVQQMLQMRPGNRPASMAVVKQELQRILAQVQSSAKPVPSPVIPVAEAQPIELGPFGELRIEQGEGVGNMYKLHKETTSIGRALECDIVLEDFAVSRLHITISKNNNVYTVKDEGSANGTKLNGQLINKYQPVPLQFNDRIQVGQTIFTFTYDSFRLL